MFEKSTASPQFHVAERTTVMITVAAYTHAGAFFGKVTAKMLPKNASAFGLVMLTR